MEDESLAINRLDLEQILVSQFRLLQEMFAVTKKERDSMLHETDHILENVENKEVLLDRLSILEDNCRKVVHEISLENDIQSEDTSILALLPFFKNEDSSRIRNLSEGISNLAGQVRELNRANQALALSKLEWLKATQSFLIGIFQSNTDEYGGQKSGNKPQDNTGLGVEFKV